MRDNVIECGQCGWKYEIGIDHNCKDKTKQLIECYRELQETNSYLMIKVLRLERELNNKPLDQDEKGG